MADVKFPMTPEQALEQFDSEVKRRLDDVQREVQRIRLALEVSAETAKDVIENMPLLLAKAVVFLSKDLVLNEVTKGKWSVNASGGQGGYSDPTNIRERTVHEVGLAKGTYRALFILFPTT